MVNFEKPQNNKFIIDSLVGYQNPRQEEYQQLIARQDKEFRPVGVTKDLDQYARLWRFVIDKDSDFPACREVLQGKLKDSTLFDLGGGNRMYILEHLAPQFGVEHYINVDRDFPDKYPLDPYRDISDLGLEIDKPKDMKVSVIKADMLDFISRLPDGCGNFTVNGIDTLVIQDLKYHQALADELARVTAKGGIVFGINAEVLALLKKDRRFKALFDSERSDDEITTDGKVLQKIED